MVVKIRTKISIIFGIFLFILVFATIAINYYFTMNSYNTFQKQYVSREIKRVDTEMDNTIQKHRLLVWDWAYWDETRDYISGKKNSFVETNIVDLFFNEQSINYVLLYNKDMETVFVKGYDFKKNEEITVPEDFVNVVKDYPNCSGILDINGESIVFSSSRISDSGGKTTPEGLIVFAYKFTNDDVERLSSVLNLDITARTRLYDYQDQKKGKVAIDDQKESSTVTITQNYLNSEDGIILIFKVNNDIEIIGGKSLMKALLMSVFNIIILGIVIYIILLRIARRIEKLSEDMSNINSLHEADYRVLVTGNDEVSKLGYSVNNMLDKIVDMNTKLVEHATIDNLTGAYNRRAGIEKLNSIIGHVRQTGADLTICFLDINDLKCVNDKFGHKAGDDYIKSVVQCAVNNIREGDLICRLGGDEFLIIFKNCVKKDAAKVLERIEKEMKAINEAGIHEYIMSISKGIVPYKVNMETSDFIELADKKMYFDKAKYKSKKK